MSVQGYSKVSCYKGSDIVMAVWYISNGFERLILILTLRYFDQQRSFANITLNCDNEDLILVRSIRSLALPRTS